MVRIIDVCSGKGGVGKTTIVANLGIAMQGLGKRVAIVDCNLTTSHLSLLFGTYSYPATFNDFLRNEVRMEDIIYTHPSGLRIVPASLELKDIIDVNVDGLKNTLKEVLAGFDLVLLDSAPGLGKEALISLQAADEVLFVGTPHVPSLVDIIKCTQVVNSLYFRPLVLGIILNRVKNKRYEISIEEIRKFTELPIIGLIKEDERILESTNRKTLVTLAKQNSSISRSFFEIGAKVAGTEYRKPSPIENIMRFFRRKETLTY